MDYSLLSNEVLSTLLKADDHVAFQEIYGRYWKGLFQAAYYRIGSKEVAKELVQNIFLTLWEKRAVHRIDKLENYLHVAVKNRIINYIETLIVQRKYQQHVNQHFKEETGETEATVQYHELYCALEKALAALPEKTQAVFRMSRFDKRSVKEIAAHLHISEKAVEYHITVSLKFLRLNLKDFMLICLLLDGFKERF